MFEVGKKVICIKIHKEGFVKQGRIYVIRWTKYGECSCHNLRLDVGKKIPNKSGSGKFGIKCLTCSAPCVATIDNTLWLSASRFAPYDDSLSSITAEELIEELQEGNLQQA